MSQMITTLDGCRIAYCWDGPLDAPVLLLSNSLGTDRHMWDPQMAGLAAHFRVLRYDTRGHGQSDAPLGATSMDRLGRDVIDMLDALGLDRVHFCGLSLGGMVGQWLAVQAPDRLNRLILANTAAYMGPPANWQARIEGVMQQGMPPLAEASIARWFTDGFPPANPPAIAPIRAMLLACDPQGYAACCAAIRDMDMRALAGLNNAPTLVIAGSLDPATSVDQAQFLVAQARDAQLAVLPAAHLSNVECPDLFLQAMLAHLFDAG
jgi:3-oxoadipate enol-lactonase